MSEFTKPVPLTAKHDTTDFRSGEETLDTWLQERALDNMAASASRTYIICPPNSHKVIGYYAICMGQIFNQEVVGSMRRNMPRQIPAVILGRLAVDEKWQGKGLGKELLQDAVQRSVCAAQEVSARLLIVHAISANAEAFYSHYGFTRLPTETPTYALDLVKFANLPE
ncbi:GNAT family N-acetyltransferase [Methylovulum psychrotolerans]|uniref:GNAT family N-acetyltransferase n=1 Tax=Methylovulum psychrotolerans TaxID=1704499 RepID=UPI001BFF13A6|nr:GNAT family N-acetyltransferase [Methylovulum psychrotolerans]